MTFGSDYLSQLFTVQYSTYLDLRLQQQTSKLRGKVREEAAVGKAHSFIQYAAAFAMEAPAAPFSDLGHTDVQFMRRWVMPQFKENNFFVDQFEQLETIITPDSALVRDTAAAINRAYDDSIISAQFGSSTIGTDPGGFTTETWAQAQTTATGSSTGLTIGVTFGNGGNNCGLTTNKLIQAKAILQHLHALDNDEPLYLVIGAQQHADLMRQATVTSTEFNDRPVLVNGRVEQHMGCSIIVSERLPIASNVRQCFMFTPSALCFAVWKDLFTDVSINKNKSSFPVQIYAKAAYGSSRAEPGHSIEIDCYDTGFSFDNI